jgi:hypothetical protein
MMIATSAAPASDAIGAHAFLYDACDIPPGMTIAEYRRRRVTKHGPRHFRGLRKRLGSAG